MLLRKKHKKHKHKKSHKKHKHRSKELDSA